MMYLIPILLIASGIVFLLLNIFYFLSDYKKVTLKQFKRKKLIVNWFALISSFTLTLLGVVYFFIIYGQLQK